MTFEQGVRHLSWRFKNGWKPTENDIKALNAIIKYKDFVETETLLKNESLAKLWIHQLMLLNETELYSAERAIQVIDEILQRDLYEICKVLHQNINMMNWNVVFGSYPEYKDAIRQGNFTEIKKIGSKIINEKEIELKKSLEDVVKEENIIKFVESQITRIIEKYEK